MPLLMGSILAIEEEPSLWSRTKNLVAAFSKAGLKFQVTRKIDPSASSPRFHLRIKLPTSQTTVNITVRSAMAPNGGLSVPLAIAVLFLASLSGQWISKVAKIVPEPYLVRGTLLLEAFAFTHVSGRGFPCSTGPGILR
jgi:hypothetical protein